MCEISNVSPEKIGKVRNMQVMVKPRQENFRVYILSKPNYLNFHVSNLQLAEDRNELQNQTINQDLYTSCFQKI